MTRHRVLVAVVVALAVPCALAWLGLAKALGAHPFWDFKIALIGAPVGCVLGLLLWRAGGAVRLSAALGLLIVAGVAARYGKVQFAASYAEDALAGRFWYFGWIGVAAGLALLLVTILLPKARGA